MIWIVIVLTLQLPDSAVSRVRIVGIVFNDLGGTDVFHRASYRKRLLEEDLICMPLSRPWTYRVTGIQSSIRTTTAIMISLSYLPISTYSTF